LFYYLSKHIAFIILNISLELFVKLLIKIYPLYIAKGQRNMWHTVCGRVKSVHDLIITVRCTCTADGDCICIWHLMKLPATSAWHGGIVRWCHNIRLMFWLLPWRHSLGRHFDANLQMSGVSLSQPQCIHVYSIW